MVCESNIEIEGKIIICPRAPQGQHECRYDDQLNLSKLRVVMNEESRDIVIQKRDGTNKIIPELKGMKVS